MARQILFHPPPADARQALRAKLDHAPEQHAQAILAVYELIQVLHDRGILDTATSALKASDEMLAKVVDSANTPAAMRGLRNLLFWQKILGNIEPQWFQGLFRAIPDALATATAERDKPVRLWRLLRRALGRDSLRGLAAGIDLLESFGRHLQALESRAPRSAAPRS